MKFESEVEKINEVVVTLKGNNSPYGGDNNIPRILETLDQAKVQNHKIKTELVSFFANYIVNIAT